MNNGSSKKRPKARKAAKTPRTRKPDDMSLEDWQIALRREFGREQKFKLRNVGSQPVFSDFEVTNPASGRTYRVAIRGRNAGDNLCSCPDFAVNTRWLRRGVLDLSRDHVEGRMAVDGQQDHLAPAADDGSRVTLLSTAGGQLAIDRGAFFHTLSGVARVGAPDNFIHAIYSGRVSLGSL
jgi:hypothetical protein